MNKNFREHFFMLHEKLKNKENFAFQRFSDGELRIMQNKKLVLAEDHYQIGNNKVNAKYVPEDHKHFDPEKHQFFRNKLMEAYKFQKENYFVGLSCRCCVSDNDFKEMVSWYEGDPNSDLLTWSNLWVNGNYSLFKEYMIPEFSNNKIVYILNENANIKGLPFSVVKDFRVGKNCIINDYGLIEIVSDWIIKNNIENHVFLFSASSLSNFMIYELYKRYDKNTYIDVGTCFNTHLKLSGIRQYLLGKNDKVCVW